MNKSPDGPSSLKLPVQQETAEAVEKPPGLQQPRQQRARGGQRDRHRPRDAPRAP
jgi:hypothetical protein